MKLRLDKTQSKPLNYFMKITIAEQFGIKSGTYELDIAKAIAHGILVPVVRSMLFEDLRNGTIFQFKGIKDTDWSKVIIQMINKDLSYTGQCKGLQDGIGYHFSSTDNFIYRALDNHGNWVEKISWA